jgi:hypothetical protein
MKMIGNIFTNLLFGLIGFVFTFFITFNNNVLSTSLLRSLLGFIIWFLLAFLLRWVLGFIVHESAPPDEQDVEGEELGAKLDISTPNEDEELINLLKPKPGQGSANNEGFKPLTPPKLVSMKDPEELAKAVRHLKEE